jgi:hypothetical protein
VSQNTKQLKLLGQSGGGRGAGCPEEGKFEDSRLKDGQKWRKGISKKERGKALSVLRCVWG